MKAPIKLPSHNDLTAESKPAINIAMAYADRLTHRIALTVCSRVFRRIERAFDVHAFWWSFDSLGQPEALEQAATVAARADMIFCSLYAAEELPTTLKPWADRWLARTEQTGSALVALLKTTRPIGGAPLAAEAQLNALAKAARMDFFVKVFDQPVRETPSFEIPRAVKRVSRTGLLTAEARHTVVTTAMKPTCEFA
jgi:nucleotide-binding universal stress UspA family protein